MAITVPHPSAPSVGFTVSTVSAVISLVFALSDFDQHHRIWAVWMTLAVLLLINCVWIVATRRRAASRGRRSLEKGQLP